ncbi:hypothetical protein FACS1894166_11830 [Bacilli bacterium]|nr:hypothetical protein FACS1894166_11830 [Bacilli bacterium]
MGLGKMLLHASNTRDTYTFEDFYIQASIDDPKLIPEPILVHFHNAPEIETSGGIITGDETHITDFDTHNSLVKYDTIYIPDTITSIDSGVFSDCFTGSGNCQTIQNVIFADRFGKVCDVGEDAFSSQTDLVLKGNIYIGFGKYVCDTGDVYAPAFFFSTHAIDSSTSDLSIEMGDVTVNGDCIISAVGGTIVADSIAPACFFSTCYLDSDSDSDSDLSIKIGDVIINGDCSVSSKTDVL